MIKLLKVLFPCLLLVGCAGQYPMARSVSAEVEEYVQTFETYYGKPINFKVGFGSVDPGYVAWCIVYPDNTREVVISRAQWDVLGDYGREETILHELGHCALNRGHLATIGTNGYPISIMYPSVIGDYLFYRQGRAAYLGELFSGASTSNIINKTPYEGDYRRSK